MSAAREHGIEQESAGSPPGRIPHRRTTVAASAYPRTRPPARTWDLRESRASDDADERALAFLQVLSTPAHQQLEAKELNLLARNIKYIVDLNSHDGLNLIDIGCGDGRKAVTIIRSLPRVPTISYFPLDVSERMLTQATQRLASESHIEVSPPLASCSSVGDLAAVCRRAREHRDAPNVLLMLGNTFDWCSEGSSMEAIRDAMRPGDQLVVGTPVNRALGSDQDLIPYRCAAVREWLQMVPRCMGLHDSELAFDVRWHPPRVEISFRVLEDTVLARESGYVLYAEGDRLLMACSTHHTEDTLMRAGQSVFGNSRLFLNEDRSYVLACHVKH